MSRRIIEVSSGNKHLSVFRGFLKISEGASEVGRVALDDICSVIIAGFGNSYSNDLIVELAERNIWMVVCGSNYLPAAWLYPANSNFAEAQRIDQQLQLSKPKKKQLWAGVVRQKIKNQTELLEQLGIDATRLHRLSHQVRSGDSSNRESIAAQYYLPRLFGPNFRRDRQLPGINGALNYGYTVIRACVSRAISGVGLHPNIPLHHQNKYSGFRLADDLMEVFRPLADAVVWQLVSVNQTLETLTTEHKLQLAALVEQSVLINDKHVALREASEVMAQSLLACCSGDRTTMQLPSSLLLSQKLGR